MIKLRLKLIITMVKNRVLKIYELNQVVNIKCLRGYLNLAQIG